MTKENPSEAIKIIFKLAILDLRFGKVNDFAKIVLGGFKIDLSSDTPDSEGVYSG